MENLVYNDKEYYNIVKEIIKSEELQKRKSFKHHDNSVYDHLISVSYKSYLVAKRLGVNYRNCAIAGLLHDLYEKPWQSDYKHKPFFKQHGFIHAKEACVNAQKYYGKYMNKIIINSIERHMFPLNIIPPRYIEGWIVTFVDKYVSLEIFKHPLSLYKYIGIKENSKFINYTRKYYLNFITILYTIVNY